MTSYYTGVIFIKLHNFQPARLFKLSLTIYTQNIWFTALPDQISSTLAIRKILIIYLTSWLVAADYQKSYETYGWLQPAVISNSRSGLATIPLLLMSTLHFAGKLSARYGIDLSCGVNHWYYLYIKNGAENEYLWQELPIVATLHIYSIYGSWLNP